MQCPRCNEAIPFILCSACQGEIPEKSLYCCWCGERVKVEVEEKVDFSERTLCSDGNCIGTINEKGICNICGKPYAG
ncbi:MAG: hypothetical protein ACE144_15655 [Thermodesulfobacteriota bacterium]